MKWQDWISLLIAGLLCFSERVPAAQKVQPEAKSLQVSQPQEKTSTILQSVREAIDSHTVGCKNHTHSLFVHRFHLFCVCVEDKRVLNYLLATSVLYKQPPEIKNGTFTLI